MIRNFRLFPNFSKTERLSIKKSNFDLLIIARLCPLKPRNQCTKSKMKKSLRILQKINFMTANVMYVKILNPRFPLVSFLKESTVNAKFAAKVSLSEPISVQMDFSSNIHIFLLTFKQKNLVEDLCHTKLTIGSTQCGSLSLKLERSILVFKK